MSYKQKCVLLINAMLILSVLGMVTAVASFFLRLTDSLKSYAEVLWFGDMSIYLFGGISYSFTWWIYRYFHKRNNSQMAIYAILTFWTLIFIGIAVIHNMQLKNILLVR